MLWCMRTTIRLDDDLLREAKATAAQQGRSLTSFIEEALRRSLAIAAPEGEQRPYIVPTFGSRVRAGIDLDSNADLLEVMELT